MYGKEMGVIECYFRIYILNVLSFEGFKGYSRSHGSTHPFDASMYETLQAYRIYPSPMIILVWAGESGLGLSFGRALLLLLLIHIWTN